MKKRRKRDLLGASLAEVARQQLQHQIVLEPGEVLALAEHHQAQFLQVVLRFDCGQSTDRALGNTVSHNRRSKTT